VVSSKGRLGSPLSIYNQHGMLDLHLSNSGFCYIIINIIKGHIFNIITDTFRNISQADNIL